MELQPTLRLALLVPFVLMMLGLSLPLPLLVALALTAGLAAGLTDRFRLHFRSIADARMRREARSRRTWIAGLALVFLPLLLTLTITPSLSSEDALPDVSGLKAFSAQTKFMSREGYLIYLARRDHGMELSRSDARRIIRRQKKGGTAYTRVAARSRPAYEGEDPIRARYGAAAEEYRRRTYHGTTADRDVIPHQKNVVTPVNSRWSERYDRVLKSSHPRTDYRRVKGYEERPSVQRVRRPVPFASVREDEYDKLYRQRAWCDACRRFHTPGHPHLTGRSTLPRPRALPKLHVSSVAPPASVYGTVPVRPGAARRVVVLPFAVEDRRGHPQGRVEEELIRQLASRGYEVLPLPVAYAGGYASTAANYRRIAEKSGAEYVIDGRVLRYHDYKRVRLAGLIAGGLLSGVHGYGDVALETTIYRRSQDQVLTDTVAERTKKQLLGLIGGTGDLLGLSLERAVRRVSSLL